MLTKNHQSIVTGDNHHDFAKRSPFQKEHRACKQDANKVKKMWLHDWFLLRYALKLNQVGALKMFWHLEIHSTYTNWLEKNQIGLIAKILKCLWDFPNLFMSTEQIMNLFLQNIALKQSKIWHSNDSFLRNDNIFRLLIILDCPQFWDWIAHTMR